MKWTSIRIVFMISICKIFKCYFTQIIFIFWFVWNFFWLFNQSSENIAKLKNYILTQTETSNMKFMIITAMTCQSGRPEEARVSPKKRKMGGQ